MKKILALIVSVALCVTDVCAMPKNELILHENTQSATEGTISAEPEIDTPSAILMEASTGQIIYEKAADEQLPPASVTKVMTLLLIFDALDEGKIKLTDSVSVSEYAASMGGSQVFLEPGETQTVDTMIKCIAVASANDACVAMAEHIWGSEEEFVAKMNARAKELGMEHTNFLNCNGLDADGHVTTARDIALMSRELITRYPKIHDYSTIWMENITHTTKKGTTEFGLANTNKLIRQYQYATGLKTGSTSKAKFCLDPKARFKDATTLLNYGFGKCTKYKDTTPFELEPLKIRGGIEKEVPVAVETEFQYIDTTGANLSGMKRKIEIDQEKQAPVKKGEKVGTVTYLLNGKKIGEISIQIQKSVGKMQFKHAFAEIFQNFLL
ncbi:MAG: D-alanyl-D-alanine carboxypeptidase [Clostridiales bacterium]|nr:D-alanyl-D-alanine carboxypeptidase [Clostridiales bacterium]